MSKYTPERIIKRWNDSDADFRYYLQFRTPQGQWLSIEYGLSLEWAQRNADHYGIEIVEDQLGDRNADLNRNN